MKGKCTINAKQKDANVGRFFEKNLPCNFISIALFSLIRYSQKITNDLINENLRKFRNAYEMRNNELFLAFVLDKWSHDEESYLTVEIPSNVYYYACADCTSV